MRDYWKAILAFLGLLATNAATDLMQSGEPWPADGGEILRWLISIVAGTWLVYQVPGPRYEGRHRADVAGE